MRTVWREKAEISKRGSPEASVPTTTEAAALSAPDNTDEKVSVGMGDNAVPVTPVAAKRIPGPGRLSAEDYPCVPGSKHASMAHSKPVNGVRCVIETDSTPCRPG